MPFTITTACDASVVRKSGLGDRRKLHRGRAVHWTDLGVIDGGFVPRLNRGNESPIKSAVARKLDEARVIIRELEKRTGLRFMLSRNLTLVVNLSEH